MTLNYDTLKRFAQTTDDEIINNSNMTSFFRFVDKWEIYQLGIVSLAHAPVHVTDFSVENVHVNDLSSARIWQH
jgi:hypothetical protein